MKRWTASTRFVGTALAAVLALLAPGAALAETFYKIQPIVKPGDPVGDLAISTTNPGFFIGTLNDQGQLVCYASNAAGRAMLLQYKSGALTPIAVAGRDRATIGGKWPADLTVWSPTRMNQRGDAVFNAGSGPFAGLGTYLWEAREQRLTRAVVAGMPAVQNLTFGAGARQVPSINNHGDIVFDHQVREGQRTLGAGLFIQGRDGRIQAVAVPGQTLPGGVRVTGGPYVATVNDAGVVAFRVETGAARPYVWENGSITAISTKIAGGGALGSVGRIYVNNQNNGVLIAEQRSGWEGPANLYRWADGQLSRAAVAGQEMPGGGTLKGIFLTSYPNELGQHAFVAEVSEGGATRRAVYLLDAEGKLSLLVNEGTTTALGKLTQLGSRELWAGGIGLNSQGQVALQVRIDNGPPMIALLTP